MLRSPTAACNDPRRDDSLRAQKKYSTNQSYSSQLTPRKLRDPGLTIVVQQYFVS
jgi:hypothetical protein